MKMKKTTGLGKGPSAANKVDTIKERFNTKQSEVRALISDVKMSLDEIGGHIKDEKLMLM